MFNTIGLGGIILFGVVFIALISLISRMVYLVRQAEIIIIERLGKFDRILGPGLHLVIPFIETPRSVTWSFLVPYNNTYRRYMRTLHKIDLREAVYDFPKQNVITKDNVTMEINALLYYQITDPKAAIYEVSNLPEAIEKLTQTTLRNVIGSLDLDESLVSRDAINGRLTLILDEATDKWGVKVNRVELQEVNPPLDIRHAMEKQMRAERDRRAAILEAEGSKRSTVLKAEGSRQAAILEAEGIQQSQILTAEGQAQARLKTAEAEAKAIDMIKASMPGADPAGYLIAMQYIKMLPEMTKGKDDKLIILPIESASLSGSLVAMKRLFDQAS